MLSIYSKKRPLTLGPSGTRKITLMNRLTFGLFLLSIPFASALGSPPIERRAAQPQLLPQCAASANVIPPSASAARPTFPSGPISLDIVGQIGGQTRSVAMRGSFAYVGVGARLTVLDISDATAPRELGASEVLREAIRDIEIDGAFAYVAAGEGGLAIVDISNPTQPLLKATHETPGYAEGIAVSGNYAYVADGPAGLRVVDVSDRNAPKNVGAAFSFDYAFDVALTGHHAYIAAASAGLLIVDVAAPGAPVEVGRLDTPGFAYGIAVSGGTAYLAEGWSGVRVIDVGNPSQPKALGRYESPSWALDVALDGNRLYVADANTGIRVLDVSNRTNPTELGALAAIGDHVQQIAIQQNLALIADRAEGVKVVDVTRADAPTQVGAFRPMSFADGVAVGGGYAYVAAAAQGLRIIELTDVHRLREAGAFAIDEGLLANVVTVDKKFAHVNLFGRSQAMVDVADPAHATGVTSRLPFGTVRNQVVHGGVLVTANEWGLRLVNISDPRSPCELSFMNFTGKGEEGNGLDDPISMGLAMSGNLAYVAASTGGVWIVDLSDPRVPVKVGQYTESVSQPATQALRFDDIAIDGTTAYAATVAFGRASVRVLDLSDPHRPRARGSYALPAELGGLTGPFLALAQNTLLVADGAAGLLALDVSNPDGPTLKGRTTFAGDASAVVVDERFVYVAAEEAGLFVIEATTGLSSATVPVGSDFPAPRRTWPYSHVQGQHASVNRARLVAPLAAATCQVTSSADSGSGTLRRCLEQALPGDTVVFDTVVFPPQNPGVIHVLSALPGLTQGSLTIDASDAGVILDGSATPPGTNGLFIHSNGNIVRGMQILRFTADGIRLQAAEDNTIGGDRTRGKGPLGEGNVLSGNGGSGAYLSNSSRNKIVGNHIGVDAAGATAMGNGLDGVSLIVSANNVVGGSSSGERNVISGNATSDIRITGGFGIGRGNLIIGNYIGTDAGGQQALSDVSYFNVAVEGGAPGNRIERNVIVGGDHGGIVFGDPGSSYNAVVGNYIGLDATGSRALGVSTGVNILEPFNRIGGPSPADRNVVLGGIYVGSTDNVILGNFVGTDVQGTRVLQSGGMIVVVGSHNFVGGTSAGEGNVVAGLSLVPGASHNAIAGNSVGTDPTGLRFDGDGCLCVLVDGAEHNALIGNLVSSSRSSGIQLRNGAHRNLLRSNRSRLNLLSGIEITGSDHNRLDRNTFTGNDRNASDAGSENRWDDGARGNYWSDYGGFDANGDGIGDVPYVINGIVRDRYPLVIAPADNPLPSVSGIAPAIVGAGASEFTLTVTGAGFARDSSVLWNGSRRATTFVSTSRLTAMITAADASTPRKVAISVASPSPGGGTSNAATFTISGSSRRRAVRH